MTDILVVPAIERSPVTGITEAGRALKLRLLNDARCVPRVIGEPTRNLAIKVAGTIKAHLKEIEASRIEVKKPFYETGQTIDAIAKAHVTELNAELRRLNLMVGEFEEERQEAMRAEQQRLLKEQERLAAQIIPDDKAGILTGPEKAKSLEATLAAEDRIVESEQKLNDLRASALEGKPTGGALRHDWDIEVRDARALYLAHPQCVDLVPRMLAIKDLLKAGITPPGVRATKRVVYAARAATQRQLQ